MIHVVEHAVSVEEAESLLSNQAVETIMAQDSVETMLRAGQGKLAEVNIDTISENFENDDIITLAALKDKGLVAKNVGRVKILARGELSKRLIVYAEKYSLPAIKMILLKGGEAHILK